MIPLLKKYTHGLLSYPRTCAILILHGKEKVMKTAMRNSKMDTVRTSKEQSHKDQYAIGSCLYRDFYDSCCRMTGSWPI